MPTPRELLARAVRWSPVASVLILPLLVALAGCGTVSGGVRASAQPADPPPVAVAAEAAAPSDERTGPGVAAGVIEAAPAALEAVPALDAPLLLTVESPLGDDVALDAIVPASCNGCRLLAAAEAAPAEGRRVVASTRGAPASAVAQARGAPIDEYDVEDYDPWEPFNEKMFEVNRRLDRWVLKPVAKAYDKVVPDTLQGMIANAFDNANAVPRFVNSLLQGKVDGALREVGRFMLNTTVGLGGLFDIARHEGIEKSREDFGQTLGFYGVGPGPYIVLPLLEPLTVRDGIGKAVDGFMDPISYFIPFFWERLAMKATETVNDRSLNLELFQGFEETMLDLYSAVRHAYLERRRQLVKE
jgi:phospholipid-binding lipoprotein MlaA